VIESIIFLQHHTTSYRPIYGIDYRFVADNHEGCPYRISRPTFRLYTILVSWNHF